MPVGVPAVAVTFTFCACAVPSSARQVPSSALFNQRHVRGGLDVAEFRQFMVEGLGLGREWVLIRAGAPFARGRFSG